MTSKAADIALRPLFVLKPELHGVEVSTLLPHPLLGSCSPQHCQVLNSQITISQLPSQTHCQVYAALTLGTISQSSHHLLQEYCCLRIAGYLQ
jgi:hypothetical protein